MGHACIKKKRRGTRKSAAGSGKGRNVLRIATRMFTTVPPSSSSSSDEGGHKDSAACRFPEISSLEQMRNNLRVSVGICEICALESNVIQLYCHECNVYQRDRNGYVYSGNPDFTNRTFLECSLDECLVTYTNSIHAAVLVGVYARFQNYLNFI